MGVLSPELEAWVVPGLAGVLAVTDSNGLPCVARVWCTRVGGTDLLDIYVQRATAGRVLDALVTGANAALNLVDVCSYRSRTFKGWCALSAAEPDAAVVEAGVAASNRAFHGVGMPADAANRMLAHGGEDHSMVVLHLVVESVYDQSPKPGAGGRLP